MAWGVGIAILTALFQLPAVATALTWAVSGVLVIVTALVAQRFDARELIFAAFVLLGLMITPVTGESAFTMALLPLAVLFAETQRRSVPYALLLVVAALLIAADLPYRSPRLADGVVALFAYPKLYGTLLLWGLALSSAVFRSEDGVAAESGLRRA
jgi:hypothetical protein